MIRKILGIFLGILLLVVAFYVARSLIRSNTRPKREVPEAIKTVFTRPVINGEVPISVKANGNLVASNKIELYSEVQGIFTKSKRPLKEGQFFSKNELLLSIDSREFYSSLLSQRSSLYDLITSMMPDLKFDYPEAFDKWADYLKAFDLNKNVQELPKSDSEKEKYFINGKQIVTTYYTIKNLEERYRKYQIRAPFNGIVTESNVNPGTLIRSGQKIGEFVSMNDFELEVDVNQEYLSILKVGKSVKLTDLSGENSWNGVVKRVNGRLDQTTQTVKIFIGIQGIDLIEGMYMEAQIAAKAETNAIEISRNLLINDSEVFVVEEDKLAVMPVTTVYYTDKTAVVKGLPDGTQLISRPVPGGYVGMKVNVASNTTKTFE